jgi:antitoxin VapB
MSIYIKDPATDAAVRKLAKRKGTTLTEAIKIAVDDALEADSLERRRARLDALVAKVKSWPKSGLEADKAFYDELSGGM